MKLALIHTMQTTSFCYQSIISHQEKTVFEQMHGNKMIGIHFIAPDQGNAALCAG